VRWYRKAADQGFDAGQYNLANMYGFGRGVPRDDAEAVKWYRKAADQGYPEAQLNLGICYINGQSGPALIGASLFPHHQVIDMAPKLV
jgi:TPR repeat protein